MCEPKIIRVQPLEEYKLLIEYETKEQKIFNVMPYISGDWYGKLKEPTYFKNVRAIGNTVAWSEGQDIAPHELYDNSVLLNAI